VGFYDVPHVNILIIESRLPNVQDANRF